MANEAGADGPAVMSIGPLQELSNVSFLQNRYHCPVGQYGDIVENIVQDEDDEVNNMRATSPASSKRREE